MGVGGGTRLATFLGAGVGANDCLRTLSVVAVIERAGAELQAFGTRWASTGRRADRGAAGAGESLLGAEAVGAGNGWLVAARPPRRLRLERWAAPAHRLARAHALPAARTLYARPGGGDHRRSARPLQARAGALSRAPIDRAAAGAAARTLRSLPRHDARPRARCATLAADDHQRGDSAQLRTWRRADAHPLADHGAAGRVHGQRVRP